MRFSQLSEYGKIGQQMKPTPPGGQKPTGQQHKIDDLAKKSGMDPELVSQEVEQQPEINQNIHAGDQDGKPTQPQKKFQKKTTTGSPTTGKGSQEVAEKHDYFNMGDLDSETRLTLIIEHLIDHPLSESIRNNDEQIMSKFANFCDQWTNHDLQPDATYIATVLVLVDNKVQFAVKPQPVVFQGRDDRGWLQVNTRSGKTDTFPPQEINNIGFDKISAFMFDNQSDYREFVATLKLSFDINPPMEIQEDWDRVRSKNSRLGNLHRRERRLTKMIRRVKFDEYDRSGGPDLLQEVDFNNADVIRQALNAPIQCGFEAETVWPITGGTNMTDFDNMGWSEIQDIIEDQEGARSVRMVENDYQEWLQENVVPDIESEIISRLVKEYREDEAYLDDFASDRGLADSDELEEYQQDKMAYLESTISELQERLYQAEAEAEAETDPEEKATLEKIAERRKRNLMDVDSEIEERKAWDQDSWAREHIEENLSEEFEEYLEEFIRDNGESWDEAWRIAQEEYDMDEWARREHGGWWAVLDNNNIYLASPEDGLEEVAQLLEEWTGRNSKSRDVRAGGYHSGRGVDNQYWRVESDSSIDNEDGSGAEIISPRYDSVSEMLREMRSLFEFLESQEVRTNSSTGLHVTMSWGEQARTSDFNELKMVMLMGDPYVLKTFGREFNTYTDSQKSKVVQTARSIAQSPDARDANFAQLEKMLRRGVAWNKFNAINFKDDQNSVGNRLIEFRAAGNQYLDDFDLVARTAARYATTMMAGHDPELFKRDYQKAVVKLINQVADINNLSDEPHPYGAEVENQIPKEYQIALKKLSSDSNWSYNREYLIRAYHKSKDPEVMITGLVNVAMSVANKTSQGQMTARDYMAVRKLLKEFGITAQQLVNHLSAHYDRYLSGDNRSNLLTPGQAVMSMIGSRRAAPEPSDTPVAQVKIPPGHIATIHRQKWDDMLQGIQRKISPTDIKMITANQHRKDREQFGGRYQMIPITNDMVPKLAAAGVEIVVAESFNSLSLNDKIRLAESVDPVKLSEALKKTKSNAQTRLDKRAQKLGLGKSNTAADDYIAALKQKYGDDYADIVLGKVQKRVSESAMPDIDKTSVLRAALSAPLLASDLRTQIEVYVAMPMPRMWDEFNRARGENSSADLRPIVKRYLKGHHPSIQSQVSESASHSKIWQVVNEYQSPTDARDQVIAALQSMDMTDEQQIELVDKIFRVLNTDQINNTISTAFQQPLAREPMSDREKQQIKLDMANILASLSADYTALNKFLTRLEKTGSVINIQQLAKPINSLSAVVDNDPVALAAIGALANYGVGRKQKGPGEYALAILSNKIHLATGEGDLEVDGIGKVELKAAIGQSGGRIGYGGGSQKAKQAALAQFSQVIPSVMAAINPAGSLGLTNFIAALNKDLPIMDTNNKQIRAQIASSLLDMDLEKFAGPVVKAISTSEDLIKIENAYLMANFAWYKDRDDFDALLLMHINNGKTAMIRTVEDLIAFRRSGQSMATSISIIPTQAGAGREQWAQLTLNKSAISG